MPANISIAVSIIGSTILGQAAIEARLVSAPVLIVTAVTGITALMNMNLLGASIIFRTFILLGSSILGIYGFLICLTLLHLHAVSLRSFGVPYMLGLTRVKNHDGQDAWVRYPWWSLYQSFTWGILIATIILVIATLRNICVLGNMLENFYFPSYAAVSRIKIGDFLQRIEATVSFVLFCGVFAKASVCLLVACRGIAKLFSLKDYRSIVIQTGLLMTYYAYIIFENSEEMKIWAFNVYAYYAFPMQVIIPIIIWLLAEYKTRTGKQLTTQPHPNP